MLKPISILFWEPFSKKQFFIANGRSSKIYKTRIFWGNHYFVIFRVLLPVVNLGWKSVFSISLEIIVVFKAEATSSIFRLVWPVLTRNPCWNQRSLFPRGTPAWTDCDEIIFLKHNLLGIYTFNGISLCLHYTPVVFFKNLYDFKTLYIKLILIDFLPIIFCSMWLVIECNLYDYSIKNILKKLQKNIYYKINNCFLSNGPSLIISSNNDNNNQSLKYTQKKNTEIYEAYNSEGTIPFQINK